MSDERKHQPFEYDIDNLTEISPAKPEPLAPYAHIPQTQPAFTIERFRGLVQLKTPGGIRLSKNQAVQLLQEIDELQAELETRYNHSAERSER